MKSVALVAIMGLMTAQAAGPLETDVDLWRFVFTQGGLLVALLAVLYFYRRDFLARSSTEADGRVRLRAVLEKNTTATSEQATQSARTVDAMNRLSRGMEALERQQAIDQAARKKA